MIATTFVLFLLVFVGIGLWASSRHKNNIEDYLLAGRAVHPVLAGVSAMASLMSGFMFVGYIGMVYKLGIYALWFPLGEFVGFFALTPWLQKRIHKISMGEQVQTFSGLLSQNHGKRHNKLIVLIGIFTILFLGVYASAQLTAGGKALNNLFGWPTQSGAVIGAVILFLYSYKGGIRASIWTDAAQAGVMFLAMISLCVSGLDHIGGLPALFQQLEDIDPALVTMMPKGFLWAALFFAGWIFIGLAVYSMPHVAVRFMTVPNEEDASKAQYVFLINSFLFSVLATLVALVARVLITELGDPEMALPELTALLLPEIFIGIVLAGLFAATMSSADSMVLSCSAALSQNIIPSWSRQLSKAKLGSLLVIISVFLFSIQGPSGVFDLVVFAVGGMGSVFGPLLILRVLGCEVNENLSIAIMFSGLLAALMWRYVLELHGVVFEAAAGVIIGFVVYGMARTMGGHNSEPP